MVDVPGGILNKLPYLPSSSFSWPTVKGRVRLLMCKTFDAADAPPVARPLVNSLVVECCLFESSNEEDFSDLFGMFDSFLPVFELKFNASS